MATLVARLGAAISRVFARTCPDPFVIAILLTVLTATVAIIFGSFPAASNPSFTKRVVLLLDAWRFDPDSGSRIGLWSLLAFSMQMCLVLVTGHALAEAPIVRRTIRRLAGLPRSSAGAVWLVSTAAAIGGVINWGLGLIIGALLAREVGRAMELKGVRVHFPLLAAAGYVGLMVWHGGLSGSAPLTVTKASEAAKVLPAAYVARLGEGGIPLTHTIFSPMNLFITGGLLVIAPLMFRLLNPHGDQSVTKASACLGPLATPAAMKTRERTRSLPDWLDTSWLVVMVIAAMLGAAVLRYSLTNDIRSVTLNEINAAMFALGLVLHGSPRAYLAAADDGVRGCTGIILQFPLYAGIMAMMEASGLVRQIADLFNQLGTERTMPILSFFAASVVNLFVPSGGGQWAIQGPVALSSGLAAGVDPSKMVMSVAYGDQLTNMLQPFWALPLLAITRVKARDIVGYTTVVMLVSAVWIGIGLLLF